MLRLLLRAAAGRDLAGVPPVRPGTPKRLPRDALEVHSTARR
eukprot:CAMPEP_0184207400 /NCGR_PEP_ID=MMETSP0976-20121227/11079_1 /TAXON_ID=483370 /ORGANISM="non described non described, Strain CCMP2097" /LENGTH=41 /DNA_ID= /DNA_START= /DNA_END= /DNA_ORIENTATION=